MQTPPRLFFSSRHFRRLRSTPVSRLARACARRLAVAAEHYLRDPEVDYDREEHNPLLLRTRQMQDRVFTLLVRWRQTDRLPYRKAALRELRAMGAWEHWSSDAARRDDPNPEADFDLSYGENCFTLAFAYDWLRGSVTEAERAELASIARRRGLEPFLYHTEADRRVQWWWCAPNTNWNAVCAGGAGLLALALSNDEPIAAEVLREFGDGAWQHALLAG